MWYKDRDFPEVKASNSDIVAVIPSVKQLMRVISEYNTVENRNHELYDENLDLRTTLRLAMRCLEAHNKWHITNDQYEGYPESELSETTDEVLSELRRSIK